MALAALNGIRRDGSSMNTPSPAYDPGHPATLREIATELGWKGTSAARRGLAHLEAHNVARKDVGGWELDAEKHAERCSRPAHWLQLDRASRCFNLEAPLLAVVAVVSSHQRAHLGHSVIGRRRFAELLGDGTRYDVDPDYRKVWNRTTNKRTAKLDELGILTRWNRPGDGLTCYRPAPLLAEIEKQLPDLQSERASRHHERAPEGVTGVTGGGRNERASPKPREGTPRITRGHPPHHERAPANRSTLGEHQDHQRTPARADVGGGSPPDVEAESLRRAPRPSGPRVMPPAIALRCAGVNEQDATELAGIIEAARGEKASEWISKELADIKRDPNVRNPAGVLRKRIEFGAHLPENDPPPKPQDHDAGAGIREANLAEMDRRRATDPDYQRRRARAMLQGDGRRPEEVAEDLGISVAEVLQIAYGERSPQGAPAAPPPGDRPSKGIEGVRELVALSKSKEQANTA